ncbi:MAG TPA: metallophosphoesterase [Oscillospiraceae bacterium]|nr:metallophosphoesterase [Oscillospiraceae bacterium]
MKKLRVNKKTVLVTAVATAALTAFSLWQNNDITVSNYEYKSDKINKALDGYKIVQISDLHNKQFGKGQSRLLTEIKALSPDIIVITGDIVDCRRTDINPALDFVTGAVKIAPVYYVSGNHEELLSLYDAKRLKDGIKQAGAKILINCAVNIEHGGESFCLLGVKDGSETDDLKQLLYTLDSPHNFKVLLAHKPQYLNSYSENSIDLVFSGHAHGGQARLPFIGGLIAPEQGLFPKYSAGEYVMDDTTMIVSRGLGNSIIPVRVSNRPDIVVVELKSVEWGD